MSANKRKVVALDDFRAYVARSRGVSDRRARTVTTAVWNMIMRAKRSGEATGVIVVCPLCEAENLRCHCREGRCRNGALMPKIDAASLRRNLDKLGSAPVYRLGDKQLGLLREWLATIRD